MQNSRNERTELEEKNDSIEGRPQTLIEITYCEDKVSHVMLTDKTKLQAQLEVLKTLSASTGTSRGIYALGSAKETACIERYSCTKQ